VAELSIRYATALFELAKESGQTNDYLEQAELLREKLNDADCRRIIAHPQITAAEKRAFFSEAFAGNIHEHLMGFLQLVVAKSREAYLLPALTALIDMIHQEQRKTTAQVITAEPLLPPHYLALTELLSQKLDKQVTVVSKVDPSVIGGFYIQVDGFFIDRTVKNMLKDMKLSLKKEYGE